MAKLIYTKSLLEFDELSHTINFDWLFQGHYNSEQILKNYACVFGLSELFGPRFFPYSNLTQFHC